MQEKYFNFIWALITGSVGWDIKPKEIWDCKAGIKYFVGIVMNTICYPQEIKTYGGFYPPAFYKKKQGN